MAGLFIRGLSLYYSAGQIAGEFTNHGNTNMKTHAHVGTVLLTSLGIVGMAMAADQGPIATLVRVDGTVIASQDARYIPAREGLSLKEGDRLMVLADGKAIVRFLDGCEYSLADQAVLVVQHVSTCASNGGGVYRVDPHSGVAGGTTPQPQLAAIGSATKARSKAECDLAAQNANPDDNCSCAERAKNADVDDDCLPLAATTPTGLDIAVGSAAVAAVAILANQNGGRTPPPGNLPDPEDPTDPEDPPDDISL